MWSLALAFTAAALALSSFAAPSAKSRFQYYDLITPEAGPCDMTTGPDGAIWVETLLSNKVVHIDIKSGKLEEYSIPYTLPVLNDSVLPSTVQGTIALACVIQPGKDGNMYGATGIRNQFIKINTTTKAITVFNTNTIGPLGNLEPLNDAWPGDTGMWFSQTTANVITLFNYKTETFTNFEVPTPAAGPVGITIPADGAVWFTEFLASKIGRLNATTGHIDEWALPLSLLGPAVMRATTGRGRYLWFVATTANALGRFDTVSKTATAYPIPGGDGAPLEDTVDAGGNIWYATALQNNLNKYDPKTGKFSVVAQPDGPVASPVGLPPAADIAVHYEGSDNSMWFTELANNRVGRYQLK